ncbi:MAG: hypothetical protein D6820_13365, partial [Lentisphaerae bacterium]
SGDRAADLHHRSCTIFNIMRGGLPVEGDRIEGDDFFAFLRRRNRILASEMKRWWQERMPQAEWRLHRMLKVASSDTSEFGRQATRLLLEYIPLHFSRRHGDPSRPWNRFSLPPMPTTGKPPIHYQGNWRDIFQNWEALGVSQPFLLPHMCARFLNATTIDGYNPYRIHQDGIDWEIPDPEDPWAYYGYWSDHQIVYLHRLLEKVHGFFPELLPEWLDAALFSTANVPYRLCGTEALFRNPRSTVTFDHDLQQIIRHQKEEVGEDAAFWLDSRKHPVLSTLAEKIFTLILAKTANFVPDGGIWMNTQRPEWNDANNALAGYGLSLVTLYQLLPFVAFIRRILECGPGELRFYKSLKSWLLSCNNILSDWEKRILRHRLTSQERLQFMKAMAQAAAAYREKVYADGPGETDRIEREDLIAFCNRLEALLRTTMDRNARPDGLHHSYN